MLPTTFPKTFSTGTIQSSKNNVVVEEPFIPILCSSSPTDHPLQSLSTINGTDSSIFIISGSDDPVGENGKGVYRLNTFISSLYSNTSIKIEEGARHEVFSESSKENSYNSLIKFITTKKHRFHISYI